MIRGRLIVERAIEAEIISNKSWHGTKTDLLVVGAGAAGATAAMHAASKGVRTLLVEREKNPFTTQRSCERWIDPTLYDWPLGHWNKAKWESAPLKWAAGHAQFLADYWGSQLKDMDDNCPELEVKCSNILLHPPKLMSTGFHRTDFLHAQIGNLNGQLEQERDFGMALFCAGFGKERCSVGKYKWFDFWRADDIEQLNFGLPSNVQPTVLISGSGDGALQDFIRVVTGHWSPRDVMRGIYSALDSLMRNLLSGGHGQLATAVQGTWFGTLSRIQGAEDHAQRAHIWSNQKDQERHAQKRPGQKDHDHPILEQTHEVYQKEIGTLLGNLEIKRAIYALLDSVVRADLGSVKLVHSCNHFTGCYAVNHFMTLLLARYLKEQRGLRVIEDGHRLVNVIPVQPHIHVCNNDPKQCRGKDHQVILEQTSCDEGGGQDLHKGTFNLLIIRHGIEKLPSSFENIPIPFSRHILPYHLPA